MAALFAGGVELDSICCEARLKPRLRAGIMPFREGYKSDFDAPTRVALQDVFEYVWLAIIDAELGPISRNELAVLIVKAHNSGMQPEAIKDAVLYQLKRERRTLI